MQELQADLEKLNPHINGYHISDIPDVTDRAIQIGYRLVVTCHDLGARIRIWSEQALRRTVNMNKLLLGKVSTEMDGNELQVRLQEISKHEAECREMINRYLGKIAEINGLVKRLNPPLTQSQIEPFRQAISEDHRKVITFLDALSPELVRLARHKMKLSVLYSDLQADIA